jgi:serine/threonine-protein kinase
VWLAFSATMGLSLIALEAGDRDVVREAASSFLARERAWTPASPAEAAMPITVLFFARVSGSLSRDAFVRERTRRVAAVETKLEGAPDGERWLVWFFAWAWPAETPNDARAALDALARYPALLPAEAMKGFSAGLVGRVYALAGDRPRAIAYLRRAATTCFMMNSIEGAMRARLELANALLEQGQRAEARALYADVVDRWGRATPRSVSADEARARLAER